MQWAIIHCQGNKSYIIESRPRCCKSLGFNLDFEAKFQPLIFFLGSIIEVYI